MKKKDLYLYFFLLSLEDLSQEDSPLEHDSYLQEDENEHESYENILEELLFDNSLEEQKEYLEEQPLNESSFNLSFEEADQFFDQVFFEALEDYAQTISRIENPKAYAEDSSPVAKPA